MIRARRALAPALLAFASILWAQAPNANPGTPPTQVKVVEQPDAQRTQQELSNLLDRYPPALRGALTLDPSLLGNQSYLSTYPALVNFLATHPEIAHNPSYYLDGPGYHRSMDHNAQVMDMWREFETAFEVFGGLGMAVGVIVWLIRTITDYRRWSRLVRVQTDVHTKLLDRFTANNDLLAYMQTPAGAKFLESSPIKLDAGPRSLGAPLARILWSVQGGLVLAAGGVGMEVVSSRFAEDAAQPLHALGVLGIALGIGFIASAGVSFFISQRLGLIEAQSADRRLDAGADLFGSRK